MRGLRRAEGIGPGREDRKRGARGPQWPGRCLRFRIRCCVAPRNFVQLCFDQLKEKQPRSVRTRSKFLGLLFVSGVCERC